MRAYHRGLQNATSAPTAPVVGFSAWYDASQIVGVADGASLSSWPDLSANAYTLSQSTGADQPTFYKTTTAKLINGLPAVWFDGTDDFMQVLVAFTIFFQPLTIFAVFQTTQTANPNWILDSGTGDFSMDAGSTYDLAENSNGFDIFGGTGGTANAHVMCGVINGASSLIVVDGTQVASGNLGAGGTMSAPFIGASHTGLHPFNGPLCEVIVYPSALNSTDRASNRAYLQHKWGTP